MTFSRWVIEDQVQGDKISPWVDCYWNIVSRSVRHHPIAKTNEIPLPYFIAKTKDSVVLYWAKVLWLVLNTDSQSLVFYPKDNTAYKIFLIFFVLLVKNFMCSTSKRVSCEIASVPVNFFHTNRIYWAPKNYLKVRIFVYTQQIDDSWKTEKYPSSFLSVKNYFFLSEKLIFNEKLPISAGVYGSLHKASGGEKSSGIEYLVATRLILTNFDWDHSTPLTLTDDDKLLTTTTQDIESSL